MLSIYKIKRISKEGKELWFTSTDGWNESEKHARVFISNAYAESAIKRNSALRWAKTASDLVIVEQICEIKEVNEKIYE